jgi:hypothetical protein
MTFLEKTAWAALLLALWFTLYASIVRIADADPAGRQALEQSDTSPPNGDAP